MADINERKTQSEAAKGQSSQAAEQRAVQPASEEQRRGGLAQRGGLLPSLFSLSPREFFSASPFELMRRFTDEMDRAFGAFGLRRGEEGLWSPAVEVLERDGKLLVRAELPGLNKDEVRVEVSDDGLIIQGERKREHEEQREGFYQSEWNYGHFYRQIPLPEGAKAEEARAQFNNGVLEVSIPVPETQSKRRQIPIDVSGGEPGQKRR